MSTSDQPAERPPERPPEPPAAPPSEKRMSDEDFALAVQRLQLLASAAKGLLDGVDLEAMKRRIDHAQAFGCFTNPTLWMQGNVALDGLGELVGATATWLKAIEKAHGTIARGQDIGRRLGFRGRMHSSRDHAALRSLDPATGEGSR